MKAIRFGILLVAITMHWPSLSMADIKPNVQPNIIHIIVDDLGWNDVGFHGSEIKTPAIDQLANESVVLDRFYVTPICSPTRAGALTGRYPFRFGIWGGVVSPTQRHGLPPGEATVPELLAEAGYARRIMLGKWHLGLASTKFHPLNHGFTEFYGHYNGAIDYFSRERFGELDWHRNFDSVPEDGYSTDLIGKAAEEFINSHDGESPFYMYVAFNAPHSPIQAKRTDLDAYGFDPNGQTAPNTDKGIAKRENAPQYGRRGKGNTVRQTFAGMVSSLDQNVDRILRAIDKNGLRENTLILFHSDNGGIPKHGGSNLPLRGNKFTTWEGGVRVVAMLRWPQRIEGDRRYESLASYIDILPTMLAAAGHEHSGGDGINLLPFLAGHQQPPKRTLLLDQETVVSDRWKLKDGSLYDLSTDPGESMSSEHPPDGILSMLQNELEKFSTLVGPPTRTALPTPSKWPPAEWKLPVESAAEPQASETP
ncbi:MAG: arylsulfatase B [Aureliella sp.]